MWISSFGVSFESVFGWIIQPISFSMSLELVQHRKELKLEGFSEGSVNNLFHG